MDLATFRWRNCRIMPKVRNDIIFAELLSIPETLEQDSRSEAEILT